MKKEAKNKGIKNGAYRHGLYRTRMHVIWTGMKQRCHNPKIETRKWNTYGGRGIKVCDRWHDFMNFHEDMKDTYADNLSLDRIDTDKDYCKENCRWVTSIQQANNTRTNVFITYKRKTLSISEWSRVTGISWTTLAKRHKSGLSNKEIFKPIQPHKYFYYDKDDNKYRVIVKGKDLGRFNTEKEAIQARDKELAIYNQLK